MVKRQYYCNKCKRKHYSGGKIYEKHKLSANTAKRNKTTAWKNIWVENKNKHYIDPKYYKTRYFYIPINKIHGIRDGKWEHHKIYEVKNKRKYYEHFPPVFVEKWPAKGQGHYRFEDGFHRVNFCIRENLPVPAYTAKSKTKTHFHELRMGLETIRYPILEHECKADLRERGARCRKR
jgi:hypothetical protein